MLKKTIQFEDLDNNTVQDVFYFNFTKLEVVEMMELEDLEGKIKRLTETENAREAYDIFKDLVLRAYGRKSIDNRRFEKSPEIRKEFEDSPAMSEMIIEFLQNPALGAEFIEKCLPAKMVAEAKAQGKLPQGEIEAMVQEAARRQENPATAVQPGTPPVAPDLIAVSDDPVQTEKTFDDYTQDELLEMSNEDFSKLVPSNAKEMTQKQLLIAFQRKNQQ